MRFSRFARLTPTVLLMVTALVAALPLSRSNSALATPLPSCSELLLKLKSVLTGVPIPSRSSTQVNSPLVDHLNSRSLSDPEIVRLFTRHAKDVVVHPYYLENMADSIREVFAPWFEKNSSSSYKRMLKHQHAILTQGLNGKNFYLSSSDTIRMKKHRSGQFRYETTSLFNRPVLEFSMNAFSDSPGRCPVYLREFLDKHQNGLYYKTPIEGIPADQRPDAKLYVQRINGALLDFHFYYSYPSSHKSEIYVTQLEKVMTKIRDLPRETPQDLLLSLLADYIQLFSAGLPFDRVNYSIAMSHVNYILMSYGLRGMENGELDLASVMLSTDEFRKAFKFEFEKTQNHSQ
jgi:hypothetical protein